MSHGMFPDSVQFPGTEILGFPSHCAGSTLLQHSVSTIKSMQQLVGLASAFGPRVGVSLHAACSYQCIQTEKMSLLGNLLECAAAAVGGGEKRRSAVNRWERV